MNVSKVTSVPLDTLESDARQIFHTEFLLEAAADGVHRFRQPGLGALAVAAQVESESKT